MSWPLRNVDSVDCHGTPGQVDAPQTQPLPRIYGRYGRKRRTIHRARSVTLFTEAGQPFSSLWFDLRD